MSIRISIMYRQSLGKWPGMKLMIINWEITFEFSNYNSQDHNKHKKIKLKEPTENHMQISTEIKSVKTTSLLGFLQTNKFHPILMKPLRSRVATLSKTFHKGWKKIKSWMLNYIMRTLTFQNQLWILQKIV
jgi:hypothetical protein